MKRRFAGSAALALIIALGIVYSGVALSGWVSGAMRESTIYRQSMIISSVFSQGDNVGLTTVLTDARAREVMFKFARALTNAYVSFELIPYGQLQTFEVVYASLGPYVEIDDFTYRGHDLIITGFAPDEESYRAFLAGLSGAGYFSSVQGSFSKKEDGRIRFEIECAAAGGDGILRGAGNSTQTLTGYFA